MTYIPVWYKQTDIGIIPNDWEVKSFWEIWKDFSYWVWAEAIRYNYKDKYIRITDIDEKTHKFSPNPLMSPAHFSENHIVKENDLLFARTWASVGKSYVYNKNDGTLIYAWFLMKINIKNDNSKYCFYQTLTNWYNAWVASESARTWQPWLNLEQLKSYKIPVPSLPEQQAIATTLSDMDELISSLDELIEKKKNIKKWAMQKLLIWKKRLPWFTWEWINVTLSQIWFMTAWGTPSTFIKEYWWWNINWLQSWAVHNCIIKRSDVLHKITELWLSNSSAYLISKNSVLIALTWATCANVAFLPFESSANQSVVSIEVNNKNDAYFLYQKLLTERDNILSLRSWSAQWWVNLSSLKWLKITVPPTIKEQQEIATILSDMDKEIEALEEKKAKYEQIKQWAMQKLLTGKIRLV